MVRLSEPRDLHFHTTFSQGVELGGDSLDLSACRLEIAKVHVPISRNRIPNNLQVGPVQNQFKHIEKGFWLEFGSTMSQRVELGGDKVDLSQCRCELLAENALHHLFGRVLAHSNE